MTKPRILLCAISDGWTKVKVETEKRIQERVPNSTCMMEENDEPKGWRLIVTRN